MSQTIRLFVATHIDVARSETLVELARELCSLDRSVKGVPVGKRHLTYRFLGETEVEKIEAIKAAIDEAVGEEPSAAVTLHGIGAFPNSRRPSVLWVGVQPTEPIVELAELLNLTIEPLGFPAESRPCSPHVTMARIKSRPPKRVFEMLECFENTHFCEFPVDRVALFQSTLTPRGAVYEVLHSVRLQ